MVLFSCIFRSRFYITFNAGITLTITAKLRQQPTSRTDSLSSLASGPDAQQRHQARLYVAGVVLGCRTRRRSTPVEHVIQVGGRADGLARRRGRPGPEHHVPGDRRPASKKHSQREVLAVLLDRADPTSCPDDGEREPPLLRWLPPLKYLIYGLGHVFYQVASLPDKPGKCGLILCGLITTWGTTRTRTTRFADRT